MNRRDPSLAFIWLVLAFLTLVWYFAVFPFDLRTGTGLVPFTVLMLVHGGLYGAVPLIPARAPAARWLYVAVQCAIAAALVLLSPRSPMTPALFFPLAGVTFGILPGVRQQLAGVAIVIVSCLSATWIGGDRQAFRMFTPGAIIAFAFVGIYVTLYNRVTLEKQRAEDLLAELEQANRQLRSYARRVEELTIAEERQRMARELHDTLAQGLAGLVLQLEAVDDLLERGDGERARTITGRAMQRARTTLAEARTAIQALRSPLERGNVVGAIEQLIENVRAETGATCVFEAGPGDLQVDGETGLQLYRLVKESLSNIQRHARAKNVSVRLTGRPESVALEIADDGVGFELEAVPGGHFGLLGMRERTQLLGGTFALDSRPGAGTRIRATLPTEPSGKEA